MANTRWEVWTIARWFSDGDLVFETIKGKHLYHTGSRNNYLLNPQRKEKAQVTGALFLHEELDPSDPKTPRNAFLYK